MHTLIHMHSLTEAVWNLTACSTDDKGLRQGIWLFLFKVHDEFQDTLCSEESGSFIVCSHLYRYRTVTGVIRRPACHSFKDAAAGALA